NDAGPGITAGVGWVLGDLDLDYAFVPYGDLGISHRISVSWRFGEDWEMKSGPRRIEGSRKQAKGRSSPDWIYSPF
ncbi:MAG: hypothetical protein AAB578_09205, partial [Elusimicrobiota bacterium]